jgi:acyl carrier protein
MSTDATTQTRVEECLRRFLATLGREATQLRDETNLLRDLDFASEDGVDFVLDLCDAFDFDFPADFNPFVHDSGRRGRRFCELVRIVDGYLQSKEKCHG